MENLSKAQINLEIKRLSASLRQAIDPARKTEIQSEIDGLQNSRNALISNTHKHAITHERLVAAGTVFDVTHNARLDTD